MNQALSINQKIIYIGTRSPYINIDDELDTIKDVMHGTNSQFEVDTEIVRRLDQVSNAIIFSRTTPQIIHISGHGTKDGKVEIVDSENNQAPGEDLKPKILVEYLKQAGDVHCVLLHFCYSEHVANLIAKDAPNIKCVIGIQGDITSTAAINFSKAFYKHLEGKILNQNVVDEAFLKGRAAALPNTYATTYIKLQPEMPLSKPLEKSNIPEVSSTLKKNVSIFCLGRTDGPRFLDGKTREGTVGLVHKTEGFSGTMWEMELSIGDTTVAILKCLGNAYGPRFLDGKTLEGTVALAYSSSIEEGFSGTRWQIEFSNGNTADDVILKCLGNLDGLRFLDGKTLEGAVALAHSSSVEEGFSGTRWRIYEMSNDGKLGNILELKNFSRS